MCVCWCRDIGGLKILSNRKIFWALKRILNYDIERTFKIYSARSLYCNLKLFLLNFAGVYERFNTLIFGFNFQLTTLKALEKWCRSYCRMLASFRLGSCYSTLEILSVMTTKITKQSSGADRNLCSSLIGSL